MLFENPLGPAHQALWERGQRAKQAAADAVMKLARGEITVAESKVATKELAAVSKEYRRLMKAMKTATA